MRDALRKYEKILGIKISYSEETEPMGTAGPLVLPAVADRIRAVGKPFFVLNADVTCKFPLTALRDYHNSHAAEGTILVTEVAEPSKYGVVLGQPGAEGGEESHGLISRFVEKPKEFVGNKINAGIYIFDPTILKRIPNEPTSIEKVVFTAMVRDGQLHRMVLEGFWMDVGQPKDYLVGQRLHLGAMEKDDERLARGDHIRGKCIVDPSAEIGDNCIIGPDVVVGPSCVLRDGVRLMNCTIMAGTTVGRHSFVRKSIIGWQSHIGEWCRIDDMTVTGEDVTVNDEVFVVGTRVLEHKTIKEHQSVPGQVVL